MAYYNYGGYPGPGGYYAPPMPDNLAQLRGQQYQQQPNMMGQQMQQPMAQNNAPMQASQPMQQPSQPPMPQQQGTISGPYYVSGDAGARGFLVAANNTVLLFDADPDANTFWLKSADAAGMPSMRTFDYTERLQKPANQAAQAPQTTNVEYVTRADFDALSARYDAIAQELAALKASKAKKQVVKVEDDNG